MAAIEVTSGNRRIETLRSGEPGLPEVAKYTHRLMLLTLLLVASSSGGLYGRPGREMDMEVHRFYPAEKVMLVEACVEIPMQAMKFGKTDTGKYKYQLSFSVALYDGEKNRLFHDEWKRDGEFEEAYVASERAYIMEPILSVPLDIGAYELVASVKDMNSGDVQEFRREIADPGACRILSDIVLANSIVSDTTSGDKLDIFKKGNLRININSSGDFYGTSALVYFYYQITNPGKEAAIFAIDMDILGASGEIVKTLPTRNLTVNPGVQADAGAFSCSGLPVGGYYLRLRTDRPGKAEGEEPIAVRKSFSVAVREEVSDKKSEEKADINEFAGFSETQLDSVFAMMRYLLSNSRKRDYEGLNIQGKRSFLHGAWKSLDTITATAENEFREEYSERIEYVLEEFHTVWKAKRGEEGEWAVDDRGVTYLKYGAPDERLSRPNEYGSDPYEIWKYYNSGYAYLFLEKIRTQGYELIFTNNRDETYLPNWERYFPTLVLQDIYRELGTALNK